MTPDHKGVNYGDAALGKLKGFQRKTAKHAFGRLYKAEDSTRRFLIADEVGLGKTLIAAGVIAQAIDHLRTLGVPRIDIIYICSNQAIARQNVDRIRHLLSIETRPLAERITLLPHRLDSLDQPINLIALTPGTSFNAASAEGVVEERIILFRMLRETWGNLGAGARRVFLGGLLTVARFKEYESWHPRRKIDESIVEQFHKAVGDPDSELHRKFILVRDRLRVGLDAESRSQRQDFVAHLRRLLAHACLDALEPDLVVLDEFQRFQELLDAKAPSGDLAQRLFEYEDSHTKVRTLLLSATPYKMYTLSHEGDEDHYRNFLQTVSFLEGRDGTVGRLEKFLRGFRSELPRVAGGGEVSSQARAKLSGYRDNIQSELQRVMSRTERRGLATGGDPMLAVKETSVGLQVDDVEAYLGAREIAAIADAPGVMDYWKSTPYLLSFMDHYKLADRVRSAVEAEPNGAVAGLIRDNPNLQIRSRALEQRRKVDGGNGRMRAFLEDLNSSHLYKLLWVPPSLPEYTLGRDFERARSATKRLVFSSWTMVPRAIAVMGSYDAERRYIRDRERADRYQAQLLNVTDTSYSLFALLAPSATLAEVGDPLRYPRADAAALLQAIQERLRPQVDQLTRNAPTVGPPHEIWYAVAPLLLDRQSPESMEWLQGPHSVPVSSSDAEDGESRAWRNLVARVVQGLRDPASLGRPPHDLLEVMAGLAAGSPANATLRALSYVTITSSTDPEPKSQAMRAAHAFRSFFRAPTSEGLLRNVYRPAIPGGSGEYWRRVLAYAIEGGLSGVLGEFFQVTRESRGAIGGAAALVSTLCEVLRLAVGRLEISQWEDRKPGVQRGSFPVRQHFARRYVNDAAGGANLQASEHLDAVRGAFNSPFWPFVLATTSVGQEGLDFHWYCHAVVHWNLPSNPVDLEQREGRIHRYHGHAIRKNIAQTVGGRAIEEARAAMARGKRVNPWELVYRLADNQFSGDGGIVPHWVFADGDARIDRHQPVLPLSRDADQIDTLRRSLAGYRMVFGQPRQDDLLEFILREIPSDSYDDLVTALTIDLSPPA